MPLKKSKGQMYEFVTHQHSHLGGECGHRCSYCYVDNPRFGRHEKYTGPIRLLENEFNVKYGHDKIIFIDHMNDLFAKDVPKEWINRVFAHCNEAPWNTYVFQTKNPDRYLEWEEFPVKNVILGTTIETNRWVPEVMGTCPHPMLRSKAMGALKVSGTFVTIEPVMDFDVQELVKLIVSARPSFINIGADSKRKELSEPPWGKVVEFIEAMGWHGIEIRKKVNLDRIMSL